jgi:hypothetical protein
MTFPRKWLLLAALPCALASLLACGRQRGAVDGNADADAAAGDQVVLPKPAASGGSVTGMPAKPGPNPVGEALLEGDGQAGDDVAQADVDDDEDVDADAQADGQEDAGVDAGSGNGSAGPAGPEPSVQDAVAVIADYYAAIQRHDYAHAWALWSDGGRSSGQTLQQFEDGFANTDAVSVQAGTPGRMDAAAGSRYLEIPVTVTATQRDGTTRRYAGSYTLRRAVVDGASADQRAWRIGSASLRPLSP